LAGLPARAFPTAVNGGALARHPVADPHGRQLRLGLRGDGVRGAAYGKQRGADRRRQQRCEVEPPPRSGPIVVGAGGFLPYTADRMAP
jgi:hypothetical protein